MNILVTEATPLFASRVRGFPNADGCNARDSLDNLDDREGLFSSGEKVLTNSSRYINQWSGSGDGQTDVSLVMDSSIELSDHWIDNKAAYRLDD